VNLRARIFPIRPVPVTFPGILLAEGTKIFGKKRRFLGDAAPASVQHGHGNIGGLFIGAQGFPRLEQQGFDFSAEYYSGGAGGHFFLLLSYSPAFCNAGEFLL
jgi:hypothetical protein